MTPERMTLQFTDGSDFPCLVHVDRGRLIIQTQFGLSFIIKAESARSVCVRIADMINENDKPSEKWRGL